MCVGGAGEVGGVLGLPGCLHHTGCSAQVPGVAENRPSVLKGDHLFVNLSSERNHSPLIQYKGYVHGVELEKVRLGFSSK